MKKTIIIAVLGLAIMGKAMENQETPKKWSDQEKKLFDSWQTNRKKMQEQLADKISNETRLFVILENPHPELTGYQGEYYRNRSDTLDSALDPDEFRHTYRFKYRLMYNNYRYDNTNDHYITLDHDDEGIAICSLVDASIHGPVPEWIADSLKIRSCWVLLGEKEYVETYNNARQMRAVWELKMEERCKYLSGSAGTLLHLTPEGQAVEAEMNAYKNRQLHVVPVPEDDEPLPLPREIQAVALSFAFSKDDPIVDQETGAYPNLAKKYAGMFQSSEDDSTEDEMDNRN